MTPEQAIPLDTPEGLWELCQTTNGSWAYNPEDTKWKSAGELVQIFTEVIARGGNLLLNVGPKADGTLPEESISPMLEMGAWIERNKDATYPTFGGEQAGTSFKCFFGPTTVSMDGKTLYQFVDAFPPHGIQLRGIHSVPRKISVVSTGEAIDVAWFGGNGQHPRTYVIKPPKITDPLCAVIRVDFNEVIRIDRKPGELQEGEL
jgi:alpha-L-fucosidase